MTMTALALAVSSAPRAAPQSERELVAKLRVHVNGIRAKKCLPPLPFRRRIQSMSRERVATARLVWQRRHVVAHSRPGRPCSPAAIIRAVFPDATETAAIRVAYCESRLYTFARNPSGASGLFQLMPTWWAGKFDPFNPWANSRFAHVLSRGGYDWSHWICKPW